MINYGTNFAMQHELVSDSDHLYNLCWYINGEYLTSRLNK
jgi:hypothetical protein